MPLLPTSLLVACLLVVIRSFSSSLRTTTRGEPKPQVAVQILNAMGLSDSKFGLGQAKEARLRLSAAFNAPHSTNEVYYLAIIVAFCTAQPLTPLPSRFRSRS